MRCEMFYIYYNVAIWFAVRIGIRIQIQQRKPAIVCHKMNAYAWTILIIAGW